MTFEYLYTDDEIIIEGKDIFELRRVAEVSDFLGKISLDGLFLLFDQDTGKRIKIFKWQKDLQLVNITKLRLEKAKKLKKRIINFKQLATDLITISLFLIGYLELL
ncbi:hypothetical protein KY334_05200 [Candidatus Woesearchaeota archaeon]|nr:hypothetical protein [Candidatus Woesearchaeota archaeon]